MRGLTRAIVGAAAAAVKRLAAPVEEQAAGAQAGQSDLQHTRALADIRRSCTSILALVGVASVAACGGSAAPPHPTPIPTLDAAGEAAAKLFAAFFSQTPPPPGGFNLLPDEPGCENPKAARDGFGCDHRGGCLDHYRGCPDALLEIDYPASMRADVGELSAAARGVDQFINNDPGCNGPADNSPTGIRWRNAVDATARDLGQPAPPVSEVSMAGVFCSGLP
jgi:hypothetical protein